VSAFQALTSARRQQRAFHHIRLAVELANSLPSATSVPTPVRVKKAGMPAPPARSRSASVPLRREFEFELAVQVLALEFLVLADVAADHLLDLPRHEQLAQAEAVGAGVVADDRQVAHAAVAQSVDQRFGNATQAKPADSEQVAALDHAFQCRSGAGEYLVHAVPFVSSRAAYYLRH
jgi:hypothetical protein